MSVDLDGLPPHPRENPDLVGHDEAERVLLDSFNSGRMPHAWLICGPRGIGKATLAYRFARFVLSNGGAEAGQAGLFGEQPSPDSLFTDPQSPFFHRFAAGGHADFFSVERTLDEKKGKLRPSIIVDDVRAIGSSLSLTPAEGGWRVVVIDSADEMNHNAANAVLKVLEEPPARALLLLVSHNPGRLLATIRSRCRRLVLNPLSEDVVDSLVRKYSSATPAEDAAELARLSDGSIGRALDMAGEGGLELYRDLLNLLETLPSLDVLALHKFGNRFTKKDSDDAFRTVGDLLRWWIGRLILFGAAGGAGKAPMNGNGERALMARLMDAGGLDRWLRVWEKIDNLLARTEGAYLDRKQVILNVFLSLEATVRR